MTICAECHAGCCRRFNINLTGVDILRISKTLDMDYKSFTQFNPVKPENVEKEQKKTALFLFKDFDEGKIYYRICMKLANSLLFPDSFKCMFLHEWNGETLGLDNVPNVISRCGIYDIRPSACAVFPSELKKNNLIGITSNPNFFFEPSENPGYKLCPKNVNEDDFADCSGNLIKTLVLQRYEMDYFRSIAVIWNEDPKPVDYFYAFLESAYKNRVLFYDPVEKDK